MNNKKNLKLSLAVSIFLVVVGCEPNPTTDTTPPKITIVGDNPLKIRQGETFSDLGATAEDNKDGTVVVTPSGDVSMEKEGEYTITYTATDKAGNIATATRTVNVVNTDVIWYVSDVTTLREALENASANGEHDTIILSKGVYKTTADELGTFTFNDNEAFDLTLKSADGLTYNDVILDADGVNRVFYFNNKHGGKLTLQRIGIQNGTSSNGGSGIYSRQRTNIQNCKITHNQASKHNAEGAGIYSRGFITIKNSIISDNSFSGIYPRGAGFYSNAGTKIIGSSILNNRGADEGGGFFSYGTVTISDSILSHNSASGGSGGAFYTTGITHLNNVKIKANRAKYGGGFFVSSSPFIIDSEISDNNATSTGGGFYSRESILINRSLLTNNTAPYGGGFHLKFILSSRTVTILNSNFINNSSSGYGSIFNSSNFSYVINNTFVANQGSIKAKGLFVNNIFHENSSDLKLTGESKVYNNYIDHTKINENSNVVIKKQNLQPDNVGDVNLDNDNKTLLSNSPVINKGLNPSSITFKNLIDNNTTYNQIIELLKTDMLGHKRVSNKTIDMGAVEYNSK